MNYFEVNIVKVTKQVTETFAHFRLYQVHLSTGSRTLKVII